MATHSQNIRNLETAVLGEQVRGSLVELFEEDYNLVKKAVGYGTDVNSPTSSTAGYYDGNLYINSSTNDIWQMDGYGWHKVGNLKSITNVNVTESLLDDGLNVVTINYTEGAPTIFNIKNGSKGTTGIGVADAVDNGDGTFSLKLEDGTITPSTITTIQGEQGIQGIQGIQGVPGKGVTSITSIDAGKNHTLMANFTDGSSNPITTLRDGADGSGTGDMSKDTYDKDDNGIVDYAEALKDNLGNVMTFADIANKATKSTTLAGYGITDGIQAPTSEGTAGQALITDGAGGRSWGDVSSLINDVNASEFKVTSKKLFLADDVTKKLPNAVPTSAQKGYAPVVQADGTVKWSKVGGGSTYLLNVHCVPNDYVKIENITGGSVVGDPIYEDYPTTALVQQEVELGKTYAVTMHNLDMSKSDYKTAEIDGTKPIQDIYMAYFTAYVKVKTNIGASGYLENQTSKEKITVNKSTQEEQTITVTDKGVWRFVSQLYGNTKYDDSAIINIEGETANTSVYFGVFDVTWDNHSEFDNATLVMTNASGTDTYEQTTDTSGIIHFATKNAEEYTINKKNTSYAVKGTTVLGSAISKKIQTIPDGESAEITGVEADDVATWILCGGLSASHSTFASLCADTSTLSALLTDENANKYLVRLGTNYASGLVTNTNFQTQMQQAYCDEVVRNMMENDGWKNAIIGLDNKNVDPTLNPMSKYFLTAYVPKMTSNTDPSGEAFDTTGRSTSYVVFNRSDSPAWSPTGGSVPNGVGYKFNQKVKIMYLDIFPARDSGVRVKDFTLQGSNTSKSDGYEDIFSGTCQEISGHQYFPTNAIGNYTYEYYRLYVTSSYSGNNLDILMLQFYGR